MLESLTGALSRTPVRLAAAFVALLALFGLALWMALYTFDRLGDAEADVAELEDTKHAGHSVAAMIREQYIHQTQTIIAWDGSHLGSYTEAAGKARHATSHLQDMVRWPEQRERALEIARLVGQADEAFRTRVVPAITADDRAAARRGHDETKKIVIDVVDKSEALNRDLERMSMDAREQERALRGTARLTLVSCFALAIALAALLGLTLTRSIRSKLTRLREGASAIAGGDLSTRIAVTGSDEFADLAGTFNQMAADLERHQGDLVRSQKLATVGQIAAGVAHEINNPIGVILGYVKLMRKNPDVSAGMDEELRIVEDEAHQCQRIVRELLDLARPPRHAADPVDLGGLVRDTVGRLAEARTADAVEVGVETSGATPIRGDEDQLREVVSNLINNALEAGGDSVTAKISEERGHVVLEVADTGAGMPADVLAQAFDPFFTTKPRGTGLGLAIAQAIVSAHGGEIRIDSSPGKGTRVRVELPLGRESGEIGS